MRTLEEIRKTNKRKNSLLNIVAAPIELTTEKYMLGRSEYESFVKLISQRVYLHK